MRRVGATAGVILVWGTFTVGAAVAEAQERGVSRVAPFEHLDGPRIALPDDAAESPMWESCPDVTDTCRK